jgi:hypothetical protein
MSDLTEIYPNSADKREYDTCKRELQHFRTLLDGNKTKYKNQQKWVRRHKKTQLEIETLIKKKELSKSAAKLILPYIKQTVIEAEEESRCLLEMVQHREKSIVQRVSKLSILEPRIQDLEPITLEQIKAQLAKLPQVKPDSIRLRYDDNLDETLEFILQGLSMTPSHNPYKFLNGGETFPIPLTDIKITFAFREGRVLFNFPEYLPHEACQIGYYAGRYTVHPHIMRDDTACFGDFGAQITEAVINGDVATAAILTVMFLEQANTDDEAGQSWINAVFKNGELTGYHAETEALRHPETGEKFTYTFTDGVLTKKIIEAAPEPEPTPTRDRFRPSTTIIDDPDFCSYLDDILA